MSVLISDWTQNLILIHTYKHVYNIISPFPPIVFSFRANAFFYLAAIHRFSWNSTCVTLEGHGVIIQRGCQNESIRWLSRNLQCTTSDISWQDCMAPKWKSNFLVTLVTQICFASYFHICQNTEKRNIQRKPQNNKIANVSGSV